MKGGPDRSRPVSKKFIAFHRFGFEGLNWILKNIFKGAGSVVFHCYSRILEFFICDTKMHLYRQRVLRAMSTLR